MDLEEVRQVFLRCGFEQTGENAASIVEFRSERNGEYVYLKKDQLRSGTVRLVVHPKVGAVCRVVTRAGEPMRWEHSSNLNRFPKRLNRGRTPIHYGLILELASLEELAEFLVNFQEPAPAPPG